MANSTNDSVNYDLQKWKEVMDMAETDKVEWVRVMFEVFMIVIFVAGLCCNLLTCAVIVNDRSMHTATNYYLLNLAVADLIGSFGILLEFDDAFTNYPYDFNGLGDSVCKVHFFLVVTLWNTDILTITALAIERYIVIFHPMLLNKKPVLKRLLKIIGLIWVIAILETLPEIWTISLIRSPRYSICSYMHTPFTRLATGISSLMTFIIPLAIMMFVYTMVACKVKTAERSNSRNKISNCRNSSKKVNQLILALTISFLVCWLPFFGVRVLFAVDLQRCWILENWDLLMMISSSHSWFSIVLNPLLFSLMSTKFRKSLKRLLKTKANQQEPRHQPRRNLVV